MILWETHRQAMPICTCSHKTAECCSVSFRGACLDPQAFCSWWSYDVDHLWGWNFWPVEKKVKLKSLSCVRGLFATLWTVAPQTLPSMGFSRQEYWSELPCPHPGDLPDPGIEPRSPSLQGDSLLSESPGKPIIDPALSIKKLKFHELDSDV